MDNYKGAIIMVIDHPQYMYTVDLSALYPTSVMSARFQTTEEE